MPKSSNRSPKVRLKTARGRTPSQKHWLERQLNDPFIREAKRLGLRARSAFKLIEIDDKYRILRPGMQVVDLGAAPGSWSQVAARRIRAEEGRGRVIAIDIHGMDPLPGVVILKEDFLAADAPARLKDALAGEDADVVLSDMAPHSTGHRQTDHLRIMSLCEVALQFAREVLRPQGSFLCKVLRGGGEDQLFTELRRDFAEVRRVKPKASHGESAELFLLATGFRGRTQASEHQGQG